MATIGPTGEPQSNPVWFLWQDDLLWITVGPAGQKAKNLERDPRIAISMADPDNPIHYLELRGHVVETRIVSSSDPIVSGTVRKYTGSDSYDGMPAEHALLAVEVTRTTSME